MPKDVSTYIEISPINGVYRYRRGIPADLRDGIGKREYRISLKTKDRRQATIKAMMLADEHDRIFAKLRVEKVAPKVRRTPQQDYNDAIAWLKSNGYGAEITPNLSEDEWEKRMSHANFIEDKLKNNAEAGKTSNPFDVLVWKGLRGDLGKLPMPSFSEAVTYYLIEKNDSNRRREADYKVKFARETNRYADDLIASMGKDTPLDQINRSDGKAYVSYLEKKGLAPATINKALRTVNTIFNYVNAEQELGLVNRLKGMTIVDAVDEEDKRRSFTMVEMKA